MSRTLLSVVAGNTPDVCGTVTDQLMGRSAHAALLAVSVHAGEGRYPVVQRLFSGAGAALPASQGATGDPVVILRQDLLALRRCADVPHVVLALPANVDILPFLVELWRPRVAGVELADHYAPAPVVVGVDPPSFLADISCVHRAQWWWNGGERGEPLTLAEIAARQVEAADVLFVAAGAEGRQDSAGADLLSRLNPRAELITAHGERGGDGELPASLVCALPAGAEQEWCARLEPVTPPPSRGQGDPRGQSVCWAARRPLHPGRFADALAPVMHGVVRGRGHLWLCSRPDAVVTWRSAGAHLELREVGSWLEWDDPDAWEAASPQRRTLASWHWHDYYGERRNEIALTGVDLDRHAICSSLDEALLTDMELSAGRQGWSSVPDPLFGDADLQ